jgi:hypothetical protein
MLKSLAFAILASLSFAACLVEEESELPGPITTPPAGEEQPSPPDECLSLDDTEQGCGEPE